MIKEIDKHIQIVDDTLKWAKQYGKESFPVEKFKDYRRQLKKIRKAAQENCAASAYGESQVGKSYLMSSLLSTPDRPFVIENSGKEYSFIDELNSSGGNNNKIESTGVITRFTIRKGDPKVMNLVKVRNLSVVDIILLLVDSYYTDLKINLATSFTYDHINRALDEFMNGLDKREVKQTIIGEDDIKDIMEYIQDVLGSNAQSIFNSNFLKVVAQNIQYVPDTRWVELFSLLWNRNEDMNHLFVTLINAYRKLGFREDIYVPFDAVKRSKGTLLKIEWLDTVCGVAESHPEEEETTDIYDSDGKLIASAFGKGELSALISEITFNIPEEMAEERPFLRRMDLLDFPGARSREKLNEKDIAVVLPTILRRGKVAYLFNKYSRGLQISSVLFCHHNDQKTEPTLGDSINTWINENIGATPAGREEWLKNTGKISPLFFVATKFNLDLEKSKLDTPDNQANLEKHWNRFDTVIPEIIKPNRWMEEWSENEITHEPLPYQSIYPLRDFYWSSKNGLFTGYSDGENKSPEQAPGVYPDFPDYYERLRESFLKNEFVQKHFESPEEAWDSFATLNNDGAKPIIRDLNAISSMLDDARQKKFSADVQKIKDEMLKLLEVYYEPEDVEAKNKKVKTIAGAIRRSLMQAISSDPSAFGQIIDSLMVSPEKLRNIAYDVIVCHIDTPKDFSQLNFYRASAGVDITESREENIARLKDYLVLDTEEELDEYFREMGFELKDVVDGDARTLSSMGDVVTKHIVEYWVNHLNDTAKIVVEKLPYSDEVIFMYVNLFRKLEIGKKMEEKIGQYIKIFSEQEQPNAIGDYASLTLNKFVSTVGREYISSEQLTEIKDKAERCGLRSVEVGETDVERKPQPLIETLKVFDESANIINQSRIDITQLRRLPFWNNYQKWENFVVSGLLLSSEISQVDPECNEKVKNLIEKTEALYTTNV